MEEPKEKSEEQAESRKKQKDMWSLIVGIAIMTVGIGAVFGVILDSNMRYILDGGHIRGISSWTSFVGNWLIVVGAFAVLLALLWRLLKKQW